MYFWDKHKTITSYYELLSGEVCDRYGLTQMEYDILMFLHNNPHHNTAAEIVKVRKSTKSHVSTSLKKLENKGLVERIQSKDNKKHIEIILLDRAELIVAAGINAQKQFAGNVLSGLTEEEKHMCIQIFDRICNNAEEHLREYKEKTNENESLDMKSTGNHQLRERDRHALATYGPSRHRYRHDPVFRRAIHQRRPAFCHHWRRRRSPGSYRFRSFCRHSCNADSCMALSMEQQADRTNRKRGEPLPGIAFHKTMMEDRHAAPLSSVRRKTASDDHSDDRHHLLPAGLLHDEHAHHGDSEDDPSTAAADDCGKGGYDEDHTDFHHW